MKRHKRLIVAVAIVLAGGLWLGLRGARGDKQPTRGGGRGGSLPAVPVATAAAEKRDVPVTLSGLGTVTPFNTVTVKSRIDGQIVQVAFREGQDVKQGDLLAVIDPRPYEVQLAQMQANVAKDQAQLADARLNLQRFQELVGQGIIPQQQVDSQQAVVHQLEGTAGVDAAQVENVKLNLAYTRITAPVEGRVGLRLVDVGNMVHASDPTGMLVITQMDPIAAVFTLPEDQLPVVAKKAAAGQLPAEAWSRDDRTLMASGTLVTVDNQIDPSTGTGKLKAVFPNKDHALWPNQFVNVHLQLEVRKGQTVVPAAAVQRGSQGTFAYVVKPDNTVDMRQVAVGLTQGNIVAIDSGLQPGDQVVTDGQEKLQAGSKVDPRSGAGSPAPDAGSQGQGQGRSRRGGQRPASS